MRFQCGGCRKVIREGPVARQLLEHLDLPATAARTLATRPRVDRSAARRSGPGLAPAEFDLRLPEFDFGPERLYMPGESGGRPA